MNNKTIQIVFSWCGIGTMVVMFAGLWPAGFLPVALSADLSAAELAAIFHENVNGIRFGGILVVGAAGLFAMYVAAIAAQLRRMEGGMSPVLTYAQLAAGTATVFLFLIPGMLWTIAAFRPERSPELTQALADIGFLFFLMPYSIAAVQDLVIGLAILSDKREKPIFPRWVGYLNLWVAIGFMPAGLAGSFKTGVFAWTGLFVWWIPLFIFSVWCIAMTVYLVKAIKLQAIEEADADAIRKSIGGLAR